MQENVAFYPTQARGLEILSPKNNDQQRPTAPEGFPSISSDTGDSGAKFGQLRKGRLEHRMDRKRGGIVSFNHFYLVSTENAG